MDLQAAIYDDITLAPMERRAVPTGLRMELPTGLEAQIRPRSGLALRHGITCLNSPGTIDSDFRGEVKVILANLGTEPFTISRGDRIAQMVIASYVQMTWVEEGNLSDTDRGEGGFGSTGV